ncbi:MULTISPECIES: stage V sporulation protein AB [Alteribacter]|uniref:Stage V sporulation protein AB n=1 Tax=Alteribacter keqinensis TaxID=2483800 RepID=A0A3M7TXC0_9BACI|nr:stage V sporulation protein AB [Alteribacter keqinensis]MBM7094739.1 stage V sporulation protein AB [Alteribacter salitolerans]RNA69065.1 stage V sporulation protein AB [Alteribacter keqinensis]
MIDPIVTILVGLAGGIAVGSGLVAFLTVLGIIPRLAQLTNTSRLVTKYESAVIIGALSGAWMSLGDPGLSLLPAVASPVGLAAGMFVGLLAAALTEVLNVFPILAKRVGVAERISWLLFAIVLGKITGSLFHWLYFYPMR